jgi:hypothetical protein
MKHCLERANWASMILALLVAVAARAQTASAPTSAAASAPASQPATQAAAAPKAADPEVDKILTRLEEREVRDLRAKLSWQQQYVTDTEEDALTKIGEIWYQKAQPVAKFRIHFSESITGGRKDKLDEEHLFDGCWYTELQSRTKTLTRREIRKPDDPTDPYKLGQGPFPLPFGQKKQDVLREFDVQRMPLAAGDPPNTDHLRLTPRPGTQTAQTYKYLEVWVSQEGSTAGLPIKVRTAKLKGTGQLDAFITTTFSDVQLNSGFSTSVFEFKAPSGYEVMEERLDPAADPK